MQQNARLAEFITPTMSVREGGSATSGTRPWKLALGAALLAVSLGGCGSQDIVKINPDEVTYSQSEKTHLCFATFAVKAPAANNWLGKWFSSHYSVSVTNVPCTPEVLDEIQPKNKNLMPKF